MRVHCSERYTQHVLVLSSICIGGLLRRLIIMRLITGVFALFISFAYPKSYTSVQCVRRTSCLTALRLWGVSIVLLYMFVCTTIVCCRMFDSGGMSTRSARSSCTTKIRSLPDSTCESCSSSRSNTTLFAAS